MDRAAVHSLLERLRPHETKLRFLVAGGLNTLFGLAIFPALLWLMTPLRWHYLVILTLCQILAVAFAYTTNKLLVFRTRGNHVREFVKFASFYVVNFAVNLAALPILVEVVHIPPAIAQTLFVLVVVLTSYFWHSRITFRPRREN